MDAPLPVDGCFVAATVTLPAQPRPWLRLAHLHGYDGRDSGRARLRVLKDHEFILQLSGTSWIFVPALAGSIPLPAGSLAWVPPGLVHAQGPERGDHIAVHHDLVAQPRLEAMAMLGYVDGWAQRCDVATQAMIAVDTGAGRVLVPLVSAPSDPDIWRQRCEELCRLWLLRQHASPLARLQAAATLTWAHTALLALATRRQPAPTAPPSLVGAVLATAPVTDRGLRIAALAAQAGLGETAFRAAVRRLTGLSPRAWLEERRCELARRMLAESSLTVGAVAAACGYDDPYHFSRVLRRRCGAAPSLLRREQRAGA